MIQKHSNECVDDFLQLSKDRAAALGFAYLRSQRYTDYQMM